MTGTTDPRQRFTRPGPPASLPKRALDEGNRRFDRSLPDAEMSFDPEIHQAAARVRRHIPTAVKVLTSMVGCFAALCVAIWAMGGFKTRNDLDDVAPGQQFSVGPVSFTLDHTEVDTSRTRTKWLVRGTCRYDLDSPSGGWQRAATKAAFLGVRDPETNEPFISTQDPLLILDNDPTAFSLVRKQLAPDMEAIDCVFDFPMPESAPTNPTQAVMVFYDLQLTDAHATSSGDESSQIWGIARSGHRVKLPIVMS